MCIHRRSSAVRQRLATAASSFQPKALITGIGSDAKVALPDHRVGGKGKDVIVLMYEPEVEAEEDPINPKLLDGVRTPPTPDPFD